MSRWPDFIIVGAMKAATSTLHEQLARQPGIFMSTPKEPNFFSNDEIWQRGVDWYQSLFASAAPGDLCGESSTHYTKLPTYPRTVERMRQHLPGEVRLIYVIRHPVDRLISQYIHEWTQRVISCSIDEAIVAHPELIDYGRYVMQLKPFVEAFGQSNMLIVFFDRLARDSQSELERVCQFIGYSGRPRWDQTIDEQNVSSQRLRTSPLRDAIIGLPGLKALRRRIVPQSIRDRIKGLWTMKHRPQLSPAGLARVRRIYDDDLALLGQWLDCSLSCDAFKQVAMTQTPTWRQPAKATVA